MPNDKATPMHGPCESSAAHGSIPPASADEAKRLTDLLCPIHASLDSRGALKPFDNCIACIRVQRDELTSERDRLKKALQELLDLFPSNDTIMAIHADDPNHGRPCPMVRVPMDNDVIRWREALAGEGKDEAR